MPIGGAHHDEDAGIQRMLFAIDEMGATALRDPEDFGKIMPVKRKRLRAAKQGTGWAACAGAVDIFPPESLHGINKSETFLIGQEDSAMVFRVCISPQYSPMNTISFMSANFVARELNYQMTGGWGQGHNATEQYFKPVETYAERFDAMLGEVTALGFAAIDLWTAHLDPDWATARHIETARALLAKRGLSVSSLAYGVGEDPASLDRIAKIAGALGCRLIGGGCAPVLLKEKRSDFVKGLERHDLVFGYENHPEKTPAEVLEKIGDPAGGRIGVAIDTGWFGSQGYDAARAIREFSDRLVFVHLKDVLEPFKGGQGKDIREGGAVTLKDIGHETCALGEGVVPVEQCVASLKEIGYKGGVSIEHEPEDHNPTEDVKVSYQRVQKWMRK
jgi:sugar phosphate isomerase/epimerase